MLDIYNVLFMQGYLFIAVLKRLQLIVSVGNHLTHYGHFSMIEKTKISQKFNSGNFSLFAKLYGCFKIIMT